MKGTWQTTDSGLGPVLGAIGVVILALAVAGPVLAAVTELARLVVVIVLTAAAVAAAGGGVLVALRLRHGPARAIPPGIIHRPVPPAVQGRSEPRALPARHEVHLHFHGVTAEDVAAIIARQNGE